MRRAATSPAAIRCRTASASSSRPRSCSLLTPLIGIGPGNYDWMSRSISGPGDTAHNSYSLALTEGGVVVFGLYLALFAAMFRSLRRIEREGPEDLRWLGKALRAGLVLFLIASATGDMWLEDPIYWIMALSIATNALSFPAPSPAWDDRAAADRRTRERGMTSSPSIGIFLGRPDRGARLAAKLRERGFSVVHYNHQGFDGEPYVPVDARALAAVAHVLLRTDHDVYLTGLSHIPGLSLYLNHALRRKSYVFNETSLNWVSFRDRSKTKPFPLLFEHVVHPFLLRRTYAGAARIVCNSHFLAARMAAHYPTFRGRVTTIYNGIDAERYADARTTRTSGVPPAARSSSPA